MKKFGTPTVVGEKPSSAVASDALHRWRVRRRRSGPASPPGPGWSAWKSRPWAETPYRSSPGGPRRSRSARRRPCPSRRRPACPASRRGGRRPPSAHASSRRTSWRPSRGRWSAAWRAPGSRRERRRPGRAPGAGCSCAGAGAGVEAVGAGAGAVRSTAGFGGRLGGVVAGAGSAGAGAGAGADTSCTGTIGSLIPGIWMPFTLAPAGRSTVTVRCSPLWSVTRRTRGSAERGEDGGSEAGGQESRGGQSDEELALVHVDQAPHSSPCRSGDASNDVSG